MSLDVLKIERRKNITCWSDEKEQLYMKAQNEKQKIFYDLHTYPFLQYYHNTHNK